MPGMWKWIIFKDSALLFWVCRLRRKGVGLFGVELRGMRIEYEKDRRGKTSWRGGT